MPGGFLFVVQRLWNVWFEGWKKRLEYSFCTVLLKFFLVGTEAIVDQSVSTGMVGTLFLMGYLFWLL
jgi:hypothetical protein